MGPLCRGFSQTLQYNPTQPNPFGIPIPRLRLFHYQCSADFLPGGFTAQRRTLARSAHTGKSLHTSLCATLIDLLQTVQLPRPKGKFNTIKKTIGGFQTRFSRLQPNHRISKNKQLINLSHEARKKVEGGENGNPVLKNPTLHPSTHVMPC